MCKYNYKKIQEALKNAPEDEEPLTEEELQALKQANEDIKKGQTLSWEEVFREED